MSYPISDAVSLPPKTASGTYDINLANIGTLVDGNVVFLCVVCSATSGTIACATSGWTLAITNYVTSGPRMGVLRGTVSGGTLATPQVTLSSGTGAWISAGWQEADVNATPIDNTTSSVCVDGGNVTSFSTATFTPSVDDCRIVYFGAVRGSTSAQTLMLPNSGVIGDILQEYNESTNFFCLALGSAVQGTKAATAKTFYNNSTKRSGAITIAIRNVSSGKKAKSGTAGLSRVAWLGLFGSTHDASLTPALSSVGTPTSRTIGSYSTSATAATRSTDVTGPVSWGSFDSLTTTAISESWQGGAYTFSADVDMTGKSFSMEFSVGSTNFGSEGIIVVFEDNAGTNWAAFQLSQKLGMVIDKLNVAVIDVENSTPYASEAGVGTTSALNWANVRKITPLMHWSASGRVLRLRNMGLLSKTTLTQGNSVTPLTTNYARKVLHGWNYDGIVGGEYPAITLHSDLQIGDGTTATYFDATGTLTTFSDPYNALLQRNVNVGANRISVTTYASASDTINWTATSVSAPGLEQNFVIHASSSTSATYSLIGGSFIGLRWTNNIAINYSGAAFTGCSLIDLGGGTLTGLTISDPTGSAAATESLNSATLSGTTIDVSGTSAAYHLELGTSVTAIALTDVTFTGTPGTDKVHVLATTGTTTITISGTTSLVAGDVTSAGATVVIAAPEPTLDATVLANSRVLLYNDTTAAELDNTAPAGTSWSKTITSGATAGDTLTLWVFKEGYEEFSTSFLYTGEDQTILVTQVVHEHIDAMRTTLGITDYTTITEYSLDTAGTVEIDADDADGNTLKKRLAIWYNGILTTADGATYLRGAISVLATNQIRVNVDVLDLKIENVSATYGLNFTDTDVRLWRSDGTAIYKAASAPGSIQNDYSGVPDTVETGVSGLTGAESSALTDTAATIAARLDATISSRATPADVPSANDVAQEVVNGITF